MIFAAIFAFCEHPSVSELLAMFSRKGAPKASADSVQAKPDDQKTLEYIPETRVNMHPITSGVGMYVSSGGSLYQNGLDTKTLQEFKESFFNSKHVEAVYRPAFALSEAGQTFEAALPWLQQNLDNEILGPGMEQLRKVLEKQRDWST